MKNLWVKSLAVLGIALALTGCSSGGSCKGCNSPTPAPTPAPGNLSLKLTAPNQFPAGVPVTAFLTMTNTSTTNASNLTYVIPNATNYTGTVITVDNNTNPCKNITAGDSCTFPVQITNNPISHPGSFTVTATPGANSSPSILSSIKSAVGIKADTLSLTANIGLTNVPANSQTGANGITFLYAQTVAGNSSSPTQVSIVAYVSSASAGAFNTIELTDADGNILSNATVVSGNSGNGLTNLTQGSIVSFLLTLPVGTTNYTFYAKTLENNVLVAQGTTPNQINIADSSAGILVVQPTSFNLYANESYINQIVTYSNIGNAAITNLNIQTPAGPFSLANNCSATLNPNSSCTVTLTSNAPVAVSSSSSLTATSSAGSAVAQFNYAGSDPTEGLDLGSSNNFIFSSANTVTASQTSQLTLTNSGNVSESNFVFNFNSNLFTLSAGTSGTPCALSNSTTVLQALTPGSSCTLTLTYTNPIVTSNTANMTLNYKVNGNTATPITKTITYSTSQAVANLNVTSPTSPYTFNSIPANNTASESMTFTFTNNGPDTTTGISLGALSGDTSYFTLQPVTANDCRTKNTLAVGATCTLSVVFGPSATIKNAAQMIIPLTVTSATGGTTNPNLVVKGSVNSSKAANLTFINITGAANISSNGFAGGDGSSTNPYMLQGNTNGTLTFNITNIGPGNATNVSIVSPAGSGTFDTANSTCKFNPSGLSMESGASCIAKFIYNQSQGSQMISGSNTFGVIYNDEAHPTAPFYTPASTGSDIYMTYFAAPTVAAVMSSESSGTPKITNTAANSDFFIVFTLDGGYQVGAQTYTVSLPTGITAPAGTSCSLNNQGVKCNIKLHSTSASSAKQINITNVGSIVSDPTVFNFDVTTSTCNPCKVFTPQWIGTPNLVGEVNNSSMAPPNPVTTGAEAADYICNSDSNKPPGTFKALISDGTNRNISPLIDWVIVNGINYVNLDDSAIGVGAADGSLTMTGSFSAQGSGANPNGTYTGADGADCAGWTSTSGSLNIGTGYGSGSNEWLSPSGNAGLYNQYATYYRCGDLNAYGLICVQQ